MKVWDKLKYSNDTYYCDFAKDFHIFNPEEAFVLAQQELELILCEDFDSFTVDFSSHSLHSDSSVLTYLSDYQYSEYFEYVMEILLNYCSKSPDMLVLGYRWLENSYGVNSSAYKHRYEAQQQVSKYLNSEIINGNTTAMAIGIHWAKYSLGFSFHFTEMGSNYTFTFYSMDFERSNEIIEYRRTCWEIMLELSSNPDWDDEILSFLDTYAVNLRNQPDHAIVSSEISYVEQLLENLKCDSICYLKVIRNLLFNGKKMGVTYNKKWGDLLTGKEWTLYVLLENDFRFQELEYDIYQNKRRTLIATYGKRVSLSEIIPLVQTANNILSNLSSKHEVASFNLAFSWILQEIDEKRMCVLLQAFIQYGKHLSVDPSIVLESLHQTMSASQLLSIIKQADFPQKSEWLFCLFSMLSDEDITDQMLEEFLAFLSNQTNPMIQTYRNLKFLDKFLKIEPNIYPIACKTIFNKHYNHSMIPKLYFESIFDEQNYTPKRLLFLFKDNIDLLKDIYFYMLANSESVDVNGTFLLEFLSLKRDWIQEYSKFFWEQVANHRELDIYKNSALWKSDKHAI